jgi:carboxymethylenebutenolidase
MVASKTIELATPDGVMAVYEATPDGDARGAVIVIQEAFGVNDHIEDVTRRFAAEGYHAVAPALFHRAGGGVAPYDDFAAIMPLMAGVTDDAILADVDATIDHLRDAGFSDGQIGIVGFCMGGRVTFLVALRRALGAGVGFYGGGITADSQGMGGPLAGEAEGLQTPWLGLFGDEDQMIPVAGVEDLRSVLDGVSVPTEICRYEGAGHGFHCDARDSYHAAAAEDGWRRALGWFATHLG